MSQQVVTMLLGSNKGDKIYNLNVALEHLQNEGFEVIKNTKIIESEPVEFASLNNFCNFALVTSTNFSPKTVLKKIKEIEVKMGRTKDSAETGQYQDRIIDIDIVYFEGLNFWSKNLQIPHVKHLQREFSLELLQKLTH